MDATAREGTLSEIPVPDDRKSRDLPCLEALVHTQYERMRALAWKFGLPEDEIDDAAQEIFALAWAGRRQFRGDCAPSTWLTRIAVNHLTSRKRALVRRLGLFSGDPARPKRAPAGRQPELEKADTHALAMACVRRLRPKLRAAFVLRYVEGMACAEVAETLGIPEATVRTRVFHARRKLRDMLRGLEL